MDDELRRASETIAVLEETIKIQDATIKRKQEVKIILMTACKRVLEVLDQRNTGAAWEDHIHSILTVAIEECGGNRDDSLRP